MKIVIIWWTSWFGKWLAKYIKNNFDQNIVIIWTNPEKWKEVANKLNVKFSDDPKKEVKDANVVIFSAPISKMEEVIKDVWPYINQDAIVWDVCSIKGFVAKALKKYCPSTCTIIPTHPMFWPYITDIAEQVFVLTADETTKQSQPYKWLVDYLQKKEAKIIETTPDYHDKIMWIVQWLTHINMFTIWETIRRLNIPVEETLKFVSPIYKLLITSVARYVWHNPRLYWDIQMFNPEVIKVHNKFMEVINDFNKTVKEKNEEKFINLIEETKKFFWEKNCSFWQKYTDKIIYFIQSQRKKVEENIWKELTFENIYSNEIKKWIVEKIEENQIILNTGEKLNLNEWVVS